MFRRKRKGTKVQHASTDHSSALNQRIKKRRIRKDTSFLLIPFFIILIFLSLHSNFEGIFITVRFADNLIDIDGNNETDGVTDGIKDGFDDGFDSSDGLIKGRGYGFDDFNRINEGFTYKNDAANDYPSESLSTSKMMMAPSNIRRVACVESSQAPVLRAFHVKGYKTISYKRGETYKTCLQKNITAIIWAKHVVSTKARRSFQPWHRFNLFSKGGGLNSKSQLLENIRNWSERTGTSIPFVPETFILPQEKMRVLRRMTKEKGVSKPWVAKIPLADNGIGIAMFGPNATAIKTMIETLSSNDKSDEELMKTLRNTLVYTQRDDLQKNESFEKMIQNAEKSRSPLILQQYICNELSYEGRKSDLRVFFLVASVRPLIVFYHEGYLRVSPKKYDTSKFTSTRDHITNLNRFETSANNVIGFEKWDIVLRKYTKNKQSILSEDIIDDPLEHIEKQIMHAIAASMAASRDVVFTGFGNTKGEMQNGFALYGADFIVDKHLNVWLTEFQASPGVSGHSDKTPWKKAFHDELLPSTIEIMEEVYTKQGKGKEVSPIKNNGKFKLVFNDTFQYTYDFERQLFAKGDC